MPGGETDWDVDQELESEEVSELSSDSTVLLAANIPKDHPPSNDVNMREHYKGLVKTAIQHDGWYSGQQITVHWLVMTLAGLEMRPITPEALWEWEEIEGSPGFDGVPSYEDLFPSERQRP